MTPVKSLSIKQRYPVTIQLSDTPMNRVFWSLKQDVKILILMQILIREKLSQLRAAWKFPCLKKHAAVWLSPPLLALARSKFFTNSMSMCHSERSEESLFNNPGGRETLRSAQGDTTTTPPQFGIRFIKSSKGISKR